MQRRNSKDYQLRPKGKANIFQKFNVEEEELLEDVSFHDEYRNSQHRPKRRKNKKKVDHQRDFQYNFKDSSGQEEDLDLYDDNFVMDRLPENPHELEALLKTVNLKIKTYKQQFLKQQTQNAVNPSCVGENSIPICADITKFNFELLRKKQLQVGQRMFDVIMMDPPWKLSTSQPSRGVAIQYDSLSDEYIQKIPIHRLQNNGLLIIWAINAKYAFTVNLMHKWGYKLVDSISWVKKTVNAKIAKGHGFYLQHAKETCLIGIKDTLPQIQMNIRSDVIFSQRRGQSQKPTQIYDYIEELVPNGYYLEIFGRRNNLRKNWVTIGNQL